MANKFVSNLTQSSDSIRGERASFVAEDAKDAAINILAVENQKLRDLKKAKMKLSDMNVDSELSLQVTRDNFDAKKWVNDMLNLDVQILNQEIKVKLADNLNKEWFADSEGTTTTI